MAYPDLTEVAFRSLVRDGAEVAAETRLFLFKAQTPFQRPKATAPPVLNPRHMLS